MSDLIRRIKQRKIVQWLVVYVTGAWAILQVIDTLSGSIPPLASIQTPLLVVGLLGVPIVLVLAWYHGEQGRQRVSGPELVIIATLLALTGGVFALLNARSTASATAIADPAGLDMTTAIAVLPAFTAGTDAAEVGQVIVTEVSSGLDVVPGWRAVSPRTVYARWRERVPEGQTADDATSLEIARSTFASYAVLPTVTALGDSVSVTAEIYDLHERSAPNRTIEVTGSTASPFAIAAEVAIQVLGAVLEGEGQIPAIDLSRTSSESAEALQAFVQGEVAYREFRLEDARDAFNRALQHDSTFARADYRLIEVLSWGATVDLEARAMHMASALRHIDRLSQREALVVRGMAEPDLRKQIPLLREAVTRFPDDATAWNQLGEGLVHGPGALSPTTEIDSVFMRAVELDPRRAILYPHPVAFAFLELADSARAQELTSQYVAAVTAVSGPPSADVDPRGGPLALQLAFGDSANRRVARSLVDPAAESFDPVSPAVSGYLNHPRYYDILRPMFVAGHVPELYQVWEPFVFDRDIQWRGHLRAALDSLPEQHAKDAAIRSLHDAAIMGVPVPVDVMREHFGAQWITPDTEPWRLMRAGMFAADEGRWPDHERAVELLATAVGPDDGPLSNPRPRVDLATAYGDLRREDPASALTTLIDLTATGQADTRMAMWLLGEAYFALGQYADAERVFRTGALDERYGYFSTEPLVRLRLAQSLDAQGEATEAIEVYREFTEQWAAADEALQPLVRDALDAIARLQRERG